MWLVMMGVWLRFAIVAMNHMVRRMIGWLGSSRE
jgi:hypothetical protein